MTTAVAADPSELLRELRSLCARLPLPQPGWHPYVALIVACREDFERTIDLAAESRDTLRLFEALAGGAPEPGFEPDASPALSAAWKRLEGLPIPAGQHPYLDEILPALEALRLLLIALSHSGAA